MTALISCQSERQGDVRFAAAQQDIFLAVEVLRVSQIAVRRIFAYSSTAFVLRYPTENTPPMRSEALLEPK